MFSLVQVSCLRIPAVRTILKIPQRVVHDSDKLPPQEGFIKSFKRGKGLSSESGPGESGLKVVWDPTVLLYIGWKNAEINHQLQERERRMQNHLELAARGK